MNITGNLEIHRERVLAIPQDWGWSLVMELTTESDETCEISFTKNDGLLEIDQEFKYPVLFAHLNRIIQQDRSLFRAMQHVPFMDGAVEMREDRSFICLDIPPGLWKTWPIAIKWRKHDLTEFKSSWPTQVYLQRWLPNDLDLWDISDKQVFTSVTKTAAGEFVDPQRVVIRRMFERGTGFNFKGIRSDDWYAARAKKKKDLANRYEYQG